MASIRPGRRSSWSRRPRRFARTPRTGTTTLHVRAARMAAASARASPADGVVRDDVLDTHPHGSIAMHDAIVHSCNAYFAQLAVRLGPRPLLDTAEPPASLLRGTTPPNRLHATLPQAGYGQGDVVATPLRMARVAAADRQWRPSARAAHRERRVRQQDAEPQRLLSAGGGEAARRRAPRRRARGHRTRSCGTSVAHCRQDRHRRNRGRAVARLVRRLRAATGRRGRKDCRSPC